MQNPYNEGLARGRVAGAVAGDCPYSSTLMARERAQWLAGFAALPTPCSAPAAAAVPRLR